VCTCLDVIGAYVSWIDVALIANKQFVDVLLRFMTLPLLRESACDCVHEIICKGMDPTAKTTLIESFVSVLETAGLLKVADVCCCYSVKLTACADNILLLLYSFSRCCVEKLLKLDRL